MPKPLRPLCLGPIFVRTWRIGKFVMEETSSDVVRVATLNLWGRRGAWEERRSVPIEGFRKLRPDLVAFQEAVVGDGYDQVTDILGPGYHVAHQTEREAGRGGDIEDGQGISIASCWPLGYVREPDLNVTPRTANFACGTLIAEVLAPEPVGSLLDANLPMAYSSPPASVGSSSSRPASSARARKRAEPTASSNASADSGASGKPALAKRSALSASRRLLARPRSFLVSVGWVGTRRFSASQQARLAVSPILSVSGRMSRVLTKSRTSSRSPGVAKRLSSLSVATGRSYPARRTTPAPKPAARTKRAGSPNAMGRLDRLARPPTSTGPTKDPR
jgi:hypothetical protein